MRAKLVLTGFLGVAAVAGAQDVATPSRKIGAAEAQDNYERRLTVTGTVAQVSMREKLVYLNLDQPFPKSPFTAVIFSRSTNQFGDLKSLQGKSVEITGRIEEYKEKPQIVLNSTNQLKVVGVAKER